MKNKHLLLLIPSTNSSKRTEMFSDNTITKLKELKASLNISSPDFAKLYHLMDAAYKDGFDYGCVRSREEAIPLGTLADMTIQELVNLIRPDDD